MKSLIRGLLRFVCNGTDTAPDDSTVTDMDLRIHSIKRNFSAVLILLTCSITTGMSFLSVAHLLYHISERLYGIALNHLVIPLGRRSRGTRDPTIAATVVGRRPTYDRFTVLWLSLSHFSYAVG